MPDSPDRTLGSDYTVSKSDLALTGPFGGARPSTEPSRRVASPAPFHPTYGFLYAGSKMGQNGFGSQHTLQEDLANGQDDEVRRPDAWLQRSHRGQGRQRGDGQGVGARQDEARSQDRGARHGRKGEGRDQREEVVLDLQIQRLAGLDASLKVPPVPA